MILRNPFNKIYTEHDETLPLEILVRDGYCADKIGHDMDRCFALILSHHINCNLSSKQILPVSFTPLFPVCVKEWKGDTAQKF